MSRSGGASEATAGRGRDWDIAAFRWRNAASYAKRGSSGNRSRQDPAADRPGIPSRRGHGAPPQAGRAHVGDLLGVELHRAHIEAHRLEHAISAELLVNIVTRLGNPTTCPFGGPIPGSGYERSSTEVIPLSQAEVGQRYILNRIPEEDYEFLRYLVEHKVLPDTDLWVMEAVPIRGVITFATTEGEVSVSYKSSERILVRRAE